MARSVLRWLATIWIFALIAGSLVPGHAKQALGLIGGRRPNREHRVVHFVGFGGAELLLLLLATRRRQEVYCVAGIVGLGVGIELAQDFALHGGYVEWWDVRDDVCGISAAILVVNTTRARKWTVT